MRQFIKFWAVIQVILYNPDARFVGKVEETESFSLIPHQADKAILHQLTDNVTVNACFKGFIEVYNSASAGALCLSDWSQARDFLQSFNTADEWKKDLKKFPIGLLFFDHLSMPHLNHAYRLECLKLLLGMGIIDFLHAFMTLISYMLAPSAEKYEDLDYLEQFFLRDPDKVNRKIHIMPINLSILYHGLRLEKPGLVKFMLAQPNIEININFGDAYTTALMYVFIWKNMTSKLEITELLLKKKATMSLSLMNGPKTITEFGIFQGSFALVKLFLENGASVNLEGNSEYASSPLAIAVLSKKLNVTECEEMVNLLVEKGAKIEEMIPSGIVPYNPDTESIIGSEIIGVTKITDAIDLTDLTERVRFRETLPDILRELLKKREKQKLSDDIQFLKQRIQLLDKLKSRSNSYTLYNIIGGFAAAVLTAYGAYQLYLYFRPARKPCPVPKPFNPPLPSTAKKPTSRRGSSGATKNDAPPAAQEIPDLRAALKIGDDRIVKQSLQNELKHRTISINDRFGEEEDTLLMQLVRANLISSIKFFIENFSEFCKGEDLKINYLDGFNSKGEPTQLMACDYFNYVNHPTQGETALIIACKNNNSEIAKYLLNHVAGLRTGIRDTKNGKDALSYAIEHSQDSLVAQIKALDPEDKVITKPVVQAPPSVQPVAKQTFRKRRAKQRKCSDSSLPPVQLKSEPETKQRRFSEAYLPIPSEPRPQQDAKLNFRAGETMRRALQNLAQAYAICPDDPREVFLRHCSMLTYIFTLLTEANKYSRFMEEQRAYNRTIVGSREFWIFRTGLGHQILPLLMMGKEIKEPPVDPLVLIEKTAAQLIRLIPAQLIQKTDLSQEELREFYSIFGLQLRIVIPSSVPALPISATDLGGFLTKFHNQLVDLSRIEEEHVFFVEQFAIPVLKEISEQLAADARVSLQSQDPRLKSTFILDYAAVKKHHLQFWQVLVMLLAACGDMDEKAFLEGSLLRQFIGSCHTHIRNPVLHFRRVSEDAVTFLCEEAKNLAKQKDAPMIDWGNTCFWLYYMKKNLGKLDSALTEARFQTEQTDIILGYLDLPPPKRIPVNCPSEDWPPLAPS
jgi:ankyrin repeat protein